MSATKTTLSKSVLQMKFMKRTKLKVEQAEEEAQGRAMYANEITSKMLGDSSLYIIEPSYVPCEDLIDGHVSFRGINPEIERLMEKEQIAKQQPVDREMTKDVSDKDMVQHYNLVNTISRKFDRKSGRKTMSLEPASKRGRFQKPDDEDF